MIAIPVAGIGEITGLRGCPDRQPFRHHVGEAFILSEAAAGI
jgi:hypothetical protein